MSHPKTVEQAVSPATINKSHRLSLGLFKVYPGEHVQKVPKIIKTIVGERLAKSATLIALVVINPVEFSQPRLHVTV